MPQITVDAEQCSVCEQSKPCTEFYASELLGPKRCKPCFRVRIDKQNRRSGRLSTSLSLKEQAWLDSLLRAVPSSSLRDLARRPEYITIARKVTAMVARTAARKDAG